MLYGVGAMLRGGETAGERVRMRAENGIVGGSRTIRHILGCTVLTTADGWLLVRGQWYGPDAIYAAAVRYGCVARLSV